MNIKRAIIKVKAQRRRASEAAAKRKLQATQMETNRLRKETKAAERQRQADRELKQARTARSRQLNSKNKGKAQGSGLGSMLKRGYQALERYSASEDKPKRITKPATKTARATPKRKVARKGKRN